MIDYIILISISCFFWYVFKSTIIFKKKYKFYVNFMNWLVLIMAWVNLIMSVIVLVMVVLKMLGVNV